MNPHSPAPDHWVGTDVGLVRETNEDAFLWMGPDQAGQPVWLWVVCDGMGGMAGGALASALTVRTFHETWAQCLRQSRDPGEALQETAALANRRVLEETRRNPALQGMGCTLVALALDARGAWVGHAGDARAWVSREGMVELLTRDHALPQGGALTRVVGRPEFTLELHPGNPHPLDQATFLLATDGAWSTWEDRHIQHALFRCHARDAVEALADLARLAWSDDNLTIAVVRMAPPVRMMATDKAGLLASLSHRPDADAQVRTMMFGGEAPPPRDPTPPPHSNLTLPAPVASPAPVSPTGTLVFGRDQIQAMVAAAHAAASPPPEPAQAPGAAVSGFGGTIPPNSRVEPAGPTLASTLLLHRGDLDALRLQLGMDAQAPPTRPRRERTVALSAAEVEAMRAQAAASGGSKAGRPLRWLAAGVVVAVLAGAGVWALRASQATQTVVEEGSTPPVPRVHDPPPPHGSPPRPAPPTGVYPLDAMPWYAVVDAEGGRTLQVDAHPITASQLSRMRGIEPDLDLVYRASSRRLFELLPCAGVQGEGPDASATSPACLAPEAAEAYCMAVGRRLASAEDWAFVKTFGADHLVPSHGRWWRTQADGPAPPVPGPPEGIVGMADGVVEVLRSERSVLAAGDLEVLGGSEADPVQRRPGLWTALRNRTLALDEIPMLAARCVWVTPTPGEEDGAAAELAVVADIDAPPVPVPEGPGEGEGAVAAAPTAPRPAAARPRPAATGTATAPVRNSEDPTRAPEGSPPSEAVRRQARRIPAQPEAPARSRSGRMELMDPVFLPPSMEAFEAQVADPADDAR